MLTKEPTAASEIPQYSSEQVHSIAFNGTLIRYVTDPKGTRYYYYNDVCKTIGRRPNYKPIIVKRSNEYKHISVSTLKSIFTISAITAQGIKLMSMVLNSKTLKTLAQQALNEHPNESKPKPQQPQANSISKLVDKAQHLIGTTVNSIIRNVAKQPLYSDTIPYEFKGDEATFTITDSNANIHVITLTTEQTYKLIGSLAVAITDHNDGQGERMSMATEQEIINAVFNLLTETDRLPKDNK